MQFIFNSGVAKKVGVDGAIMLENIYYWILKNRAMKSIFMMDSIGPIIQSKLFLNYFHSGVLGKYLEY